jgi:hypothetical protein
MSFKSYAKTALSLFLVLLIIVSVFSFTASADTIVESNPGGTTEPTAEPVHNGLTGDCIWEYNPETKTLTISGYGNMGGEDNAENYPWRNLEIKNLVIENGVKSIPKAAFSNCGFESLTIGESVETISEEAFYSCRNLLSASIPDSVTTLGENGFSGCYSLNTVKLPNNITFIPDGLFSDCTALSAVTIPNTVTGIGIAAFYGCESLQRITIPSNVKVIERSAFRYCTNLSTINLPSALTNIHPGAFTNTAWLNRKPAGVVYINNMAYTFSGAPSSITVKKNTSKICDEAFNGCTSLKKVKIQSGVKSIGAFAFYNCPSLSSVSISSSVKSIGTEAFSENRALKKLKIPKSVTQIGDHAYGYTFYYDTKTDKSEYRLISGSKVYGAVGSAAFRYAFNSAFTNPKGVEFHTEFYRKQSAKISGISSGSAKITYNTSNKKVAIVNSLGKITGVKKGTAAITFSQNNKTWKFKVHIKNPKLNAKKKTLKKGKTFKLKITGKVGKAKFSSSNKKVATVSKKGKIKAKKKGKATITVKTNGIKLKCKITVKKNKK